MKTERNDVTYSVALIPALLTSTRPCDMSPSVRFSPDVSLPRYTQPYSLPDPGTWYSTVNTISLPITFFLRYSLASQAHGCQIQQHGRTVVHLTRACTSLHRLSILIYHPKLLSNNKNHFLSFLVLFQKNVYNSNTNTHKNCCKTCRWLVVRVTRLHKSHDPSCRSVNSQQVKI